MITIQSIENAQNMIAPHVPITPLVRAYALEKLLNYPDRIFLKCENLHETKSFKIRGAFYALCLLNDEERARGVITRSTGNFGTAMAFGARLFKIPATIVLSEKVSPVKRQLIEQNGPQMIFCKTRTEEEEMVKKLALERNLIPFSPYDHPDVILGQATMGMEVYQQLPSIKHYIGPIGGGGLMGGSSIALKLCDPTIHTIGVEPEGANDYFLSRKSEKKIRLDCIKTIADGLAAPCVGEKTYPLLQKYVDDVVLISDDWIKKAMWVLFEKMGLIIEPSGAVSVACLLSGIELKGDIVCILSGGNIEFNQFHMWICEHENN